MPGGLAHRGTLHAGRAASQGLQVTGTPQQLLPERPQQLSTVQGSGDKKMTPRILLYWEKRGFREGTFSVLPTLLCILTSFPAKPQGRAPLPMAPSPACATFKPSFPLIS